MKNLLAILCLLSITALAQITDEPFYLHKSRADLEEDMDSRFPILKSTNPSIAKNMNTVLQLETFGVILTDKRKADLFAATSHEHAFGRDNMEYRVERLNARVVLVDIGHYQFRNAMSLNGDYNMTRYYFDAATGQRIHFRDFFTDAGYEKLKQKGVAAFRANLVEVMKRYEDDFTLNKLEKLDEECECNCSGHLADAFCSGDLVMDVSGNEVIFSIPDCDWMNPRQHERYVATFALDQVKPLLNDFGKYILFGGTPVANLSPFYKLWKGKLGTSTATTFYLTPDCNRSGPVGGAEIYDSFGQKIPLGGTFVGNKFTFGELDGNGKAVATFEATLQNGKLIGTWKKADGSKTLPFEAVTANP